MPLNTSLLPVLLFLYCHVADGSKQRGWLDSAFTLLEGSLPSSRCSHGFAATDDGKIYAFGGYGSNGLLDDLYVLDPVAMSWTNLSDAASGTPPSARSYHGFTSAGSKLYVHGGHDANYNPLGDLYAFDPITVAWTDLSVSVNGTAPTARFLHGFTSVDGKLYVHGGLDANDNSLGDLHSFDPIAKVWTDLSDAASGIPPTAREGHGFTSSVDKLFVHGGYGLTRSGNYSLLSDLHSFDPIEKVWTDLSVSVNRTVPTARAVHGFTSAASKLYVHGGQGPWDGSGYTVLGDLHAFDPIAKVWTDLSAPANGIVPTARYGHGFTSADGKLYVHGGVDANDTLLDDLHALDTIAVAWTDLTDPAGGTAPTARYSHGFTSTNATLFVHGGLDEYGNFLSDLHSFNPIANVWTDLSKPAGGTLPTARAFHGFTSANGTLYVHGGQDLYGNLLSDLHSFNSIAKVWTDLSALVKGIVPTARQSHGFTSADGKLYVHGGVDANHYLLSDLYSFDPVSKVWTYLSDAAAGTPPTARASHGFTSAGDKLYAHGGNGSYGLLSDLHSFDHVQKVWTEISSSVNGTVPTARASHGFTLADGKLYVHGGQGPWDDSEYSILGDLHAFDPIAKVWTDLSHGATSPPTARYSHGFTSVGKRLYVHDGFGPRGASGWVG